MKVEVLYVADCPSHPPAVKLLKDVLAAEGITAEVTEVLVVDAQMASELKFRGSPKWYSLPPGRPSESTG